MDPIRMHHRDARAPLPPSQPIAPSDPFSTAVNAPSGELFALEPVAQFASLWRHANGSWSRVDTPGLTPFALVRHGASLQLFGFEHRDGGAPSLVRAHWADGAARIVARSESVGVPLGGAAVVLADDTAFTVGVDPHGFALVQWSGSGAQVHRVPGSGSDGGSVCLVPVGDEVWLAPAVAAPYRWKNGAWLARGTALPRGICTSAPLDDRTVLLGGRDGVFALGRDGIARPEIGTAGITVLALAVHDGRAFAAGRHGLLLAREPGRWVRRTPVTRSDAVALASHGGALYWLGADGTRQRVE